MTSHSQCAVHSFGFTDINELKFACYENIIPSLPFHFPNHCIHSTHDSERQKCSLDIPSIYQIESDILDMSEVIVEARARVCVCVCDKRKRWR